MHHLAHPESPPKHNSFCFNPLTNRSNKKNPGHPHLGILKISTPAELLTTADPPGLPPAASAPPPVPGAPNRALWAGWVRLRIPRPRHLKKHLGSEDSRVNAIKNKQKTMVSTIVSKWCRISSIHSISGGCSKASLGSMAVSSWEKNTAKRTTEGKKGLATCQFRHDRNANPFALDHLFG